MHLATDVALADTLSELTTEVTSALEGAAVSALHAAGAGVQ